MRASRKAYGLNSFFQSYIKILYHQQGYLCLVRHHDITMTSTEEERLIVLSYMFERPAVLEELKRMHASTGKLCFLHSCQN